MSFPNVSRIEKMKEYWDPIDNGAKDALHRGESENERRFQQQRYSLETVTKWFRSCEIQLSFKGHSILKEGSRFGSWIWSIYIFIIFFIHVICLKSYSTKNILVIFSPFSSCNLLIQYFLLFFVFFFSYIWPLTYSDLRRHAWILQEYPSTKVNRISFATVDSLFSRQPFRGWQLCTLRQYYLGSQVSWWRNSVRKYVLWIIYRKPARFPAGETTSSLFWRRLRAYNVDRDPNSFCACYERLRCFGWRPSMLPGVI